MLNYLKIYRPINILFIALAQWLSAYFLNFEASYVSIYDGGLYWLILGTAACAAFGYWINDFLDIDRDEINKSHFKAIKSLNPNLVYVHLLAFVSIATYCGNVLGTWFILLFAITIALLFLYSKWLKNIAGLGNLLIAALSFVSVYAVSVLFPEVDRLLMLHFAMLAGFLTLCRELVKDAEDVKGDSETNAKTLPIVLGLVNTNNLIYILLLFIISFLVISLYYQSRFLTSAMQFAYYGYYFLFVIVPLYKVAIDVRSAQSKQEYAFLSKILKYTLFTGVLSILFF
ncbi:MAG: UbiA family prenyltransferase [Bacteroidia bacterium]|nr:UbiA family prenyltransferase [Bacteroidia bacterium]NNJ54592.1 UbiA family prenyltransferase [Bacteroidia bacterium]